MATRLTDEARARALDALKARGWTQVADRDAITKRYRFADFNEAWGVMSRVAVYAEKHNHHPEWFNVWSTLEVTLTTHDAGGLSELDVAMAAFIDDVAG
jgi:4a-hydroxytetrahydrobiopterin dehydratase